MRKRNENLPSEFQKAPEAVKATAALFS